MLSKPSLGWVGDAYSIRVVLKIDTLHRNNVMNSREMNMCATKWSMGLIKVRGVSRESEIVKDGYD